MVSLLVFARLGFMVVASPILEVRDNAVYGEGQDITIKAPGVPSHPAFKGFPSTGQGPKQTDFLAAMFLNFQEPGLVPTGVNPVKCKPKRGQFPIILIPGTSETAYTNWAYYGPELAGEGLCVYSFNHNPMRDSETGKSMEGTAFMGNITESAFALGSFVDEVLSLTGANKVDFVGHSQGAGALPFYYLKNVMQGLKVRKTIGLAPSLGTSVFGLYKFFDFMTRQTRDSNGNDINAAASNTMALDQQMLDSSWMRSLHAGGLSVPGVEYVNIATRYDDVLTPYKNCFFSEEGKNITNILLQDVCSEDYSDHVGLGYSSNGLQIVVNHLLSTNNAVTCVPQYPVIN